jgi:hypothetical protein
MTPVIKGFLTDVGFEITNLALQCYGGHGYIREFGMEQFVRDARIAQIYEGTNGVQAMDLLGRKVPEAGGRLMKRWFALAEADLAAAAGDDVVAPLAAGVGAALVALQKTTLSVMARAQRDPEEIGASAADFLRMVGLVATGWMWIRMAVAARRVLASTNGDRARAEAKLATARFYVLRLLPQTRSLAAQIDAGAASVMELDPAAL